jgi:UDP-N-acetylmuramoylalanine--D-glutamate ligase
LADKVRSRALSFGLARQSDAPAIWEEHRPSRSSPRVPGLHFDVGGVSGTICMDEFRLAGAFNRSNAMAASAAALLLNIKPEIIERTLSGFQGLDHRLQFVRERDGVLYLDDSKATNVGAVVQALFAVAAPVILIAGGVDKGGSYGPLRDPLRQKVKKLVLYGAARETMSASLHGVTRIECVESMAEAVGMAAAEATSGDTVMLSPACASFDQFQNYAQRGRVFRDLVLGLSPAEKIAN